MVSAETHRSCALALLLTVGVLSMAGMAQTSPSGTGSSASLLKPVGTVKSVNGNEIVLATDSGSEVRILIQDSTRMVRTAPGQTTLKDATAMSLQDLQSGDRMLVRGTASEDGKSVLATSAVVMKRSDIAARQEQERAEWQAHGVGGLVKSVDASHGVIQISMAGFGTTKDVTIRASKSTIIRRYSPDSVKFDDARAGTLDQMKPGDQLRARGSRNPDGTEIDAEEIVSGSFRNIAGTVQSTDPAQNTVSVMDLISKKPMVVKVTPDSQMRQLPPAFAQRIAMRLKGGGAGDNQGQGTAQGGNAASSNPGIRGGGNFGGGGSRSGGSPDFQQMLSRLPAATLADLHKGDAVMIVATEGSESSAPKAITLLSGVEAILTASPSQSASTLLSPWNLGTSAPGGDAATE